MASTKKAPQRHSVKELKKLGNQLLSSRAHINNLPLLLSYLSPPQPPEHVLECLLSLQPFFTTVLPELPPKSKSKSKSNPDPEFIYRTWLRARFDEFIKLLLDLLVSPHSVSEEPLKGIVLDALMEFVKLGLGNHSSTFQSAIYHKLLFTILHSNATSLEFVTDLLASKYFNYVDVRYFTYISLEKLATTLEEHAISGAKKAMADYDTVKASLEDLIRKVHYIISHVPPKDALGEESECSMWSESGISSKEDDLKETFGVTKAKRKQPKTEKHDNIVLSPTKIARKMKLKFTKAWSSFLRLPLPVDVYKEVLLSLHQSVIPYLSNPIMLSDFLTRSYDVGGVVSVMALSSLFILMTQHGSEYPDFYDKLYALLIPSIFMAKHRARFFELLDSCLKSALLPAYIAAAFTKRLSRLALSVPPSGGLVIVALIHNLLRRHPSINFLVHRDGNQTAQNNSEAAEAAGDLQRGMDHFNNNESKPIKSNAMDSSLWEIDTLRDHYCPPVSRFVSSLKEDLTIRAKTTELNIKDFSSGSYATVFGDEIRRRVKQVPLAHYKATPTTLFSESDFPGWTFKYEKKRSENGEESAQASPKRQRIES